MRRKGFTLIELLAVIIILAIILLIAVPNIIRVLDKTKEETFKVTSQMIMKKIGFEMIQTEYPPSDKYTVVGNLVSGDILDLPMDNLEYLTGTWEYNMDTEIITITELTDGTFSATITSEQVPDEYVVVKLDEIPPPAITLIGDATITLTEGDIYIDPGATALDYNSDSVAVTNDSFTSVDVNTPGTYTVTYTATAQGNSATITREVVVEELTRILDVVPDGFVGIYNVTDLNDMRNDLNGNYILMSNIDLDVSPYNENEGFEPIGSYLTKFTGTFDGNGLIIDNLFINKPATNCIGLFGFAENAVFKNISLNNINISGFKSIGGLVGTIYYSSSLENIKVTGILNGDMNIGGIIGVQKATDIDKASFDGTVTAINGGAGLIVGVSRDSNISKVLALGEIDGDSSYIAGIAGSFDAEAGNYIEDSYVIATINGQNRVGGLTGGVWNDGNIRNSYYVGTITATTDIGNIAGIVGESKNFIGCYWDSDVNNLDVASSGNTTGGTGLSTNDMHQESSFSEFDFINTWIIDEGNDYPRLKWESD